MSITQFLIRPGETRQLHSAWPWLLVCVSGGFMISALWADVGLSSLTTSGSWGTQVTIMVDRKSTRLNSSHVAISYAVFCLKKKKKEIATHQQYYTYTLRR